MKCTYDTDCSCGYGSSMKYESLCTIDRPVKGLLNWRLVLRLHSGELITKEFVLWGDLIKVLDQDTPERIMHAQIYDIHNTH